MNKFIFNNIMFYDGESISDFVNFEKVNANPLATITDRFVRIMISDAQNNYAEYHVDTERKVLAAIRSVIACQEIGKISKEVIQKSYDYFLGANSAQKAITVKFLENYLSKGLIKDIDYFVPEDFSVILCKLADAKLVFDEDEILREIKSKNIVMDDNLKYALTKNEETRQNVELNEYGIPMSIDNFVITLRTRTDSGKGYLLMKPFLDEYLQSCDKNCVSSFIYSSSGVIGWKSISKLKNNSKIDVGFNTEIRYFCEGTLDTIHLRKVMASNMMFRESENPIDFKIFTEDDMMQKYGFLPNGYDLFQKLPELAVPYDAYVVLDGSSVSTLWKNDNLVNLVTPFFERINKKVEIVEKYSERDMNADGEEIYNFVGDN